MIAVSLGGEGEPVAGATLVVNANIFETLAMIRPGFAGALSPGQVAVGMSAGAIALRDSSADLVIARHFPIQFSKTIDDYDLSQVANESFRVVKPGARIDFSCSSCDVDSLAATIEQAGFVDIGVDRHRYAVRGRKP